MSPRSLTCLGTLVLATAVTVTQAAGQTTTPTPRTPWGQPDLQGMWVNNSATPLERPDALGDKQTLTDAELEELKQKAEAVLDGGDAFFGDDFFTAVVGDDTQFRSFDTKTGNYNQFWISEREFENRTSLIVDPPNGKLPPMTPEGRARRIKQVQGLLGTDPAGPESLSNQVRCITYGVPNIFAGYNNYVQILQTPDSVVMYREMIHDVRIIPLDGGPHLPNHIRQWHGDPRGHWEGDTLVVDSTNFSPQSTFRGTAENLHLIERFTRVADDTIAYEFTVDDPTTYTRSWTAMVPLKATDDLIFEYACHEGNISMEGILKGARAEEKAAAEAAKDESK